MGNNLVPFGFVGAAAGSAIFQLIKDSGPLARADLGRLTGLSRSTISMHVERLLRLGLVVEEPDARYDSPLKRKQLIFNQQAGYVVAIDLGATSLDLALCDLGANILQHRELIDINVADGPEQILNEIKNNLDQLLTLEKISKTELFGIGMGIPGPVEFATGYPIYPPIMPGWHKFPIKEILGSYYNCLVYIDNDVNMMAVGEAKHGAGVGVDNQIFVKIGSGIGAGLILEDELYRGTNGCAGDIGHIAVQGSSELCSCGNYGCLEAVASGQALAKIATKMALEGGSLELAEVLAQQGQISARDLANLAQQGDPHSLALVRKSGEAIGEVLAGLINFSNPALIIVGGGVAGLGQRLIASIKESIFRKSTPLATSNLEIVPSKLKGMAGIIGAASLVVDEAFSMNRVIEMMNQEEIG